MNARVSIFAPSGLNRFLSAVKHNIQNYFCIDNINAIEFKKTIQPNHFVLKKLVLEFVVDIYGLMLKSGIYYQSKMNGIDNVWIAIILQKAQAEIEKHLMTAEMLSMKKDTKGQKDQIVNELLKVHTRFQARITEYQVLLNMTIRFFENLSKVGHTISNANIHMWSFLMNNLKVIKLYISH